MNNEPPWWIDDFIETHRQSLGIPPAWKIRPLMVDHPFNDETIDGACQPDSVYLNARLEFSRELPDNNYGRRVVLHELWHVATADLLRVFTYAVKFAPAEVQGHLQELYDDTMEQFIQQRVRAVITTAEEADE